MFRVQVLGTIWSGQKCAYEYKTDYLPGDKSQFHREVKKLAGDFADVSDFRILTPRFAKCGHFDGYRTLKGFTGRSAARTFARSTR